MARSLNLDRSCLSVMKIFSFLACVCIIIHNNICNKVYHDCIALHWNLHISKLGLIRTELICLSELDVGQIYLTEQIPRLIRNLVPDRFQSHSICNEA